MAVRVAGAVIGLSGAVTVFASVVLFGLVFVLAALPLGIGLFQVLTGLRILLRGAARGLAPWVAVLIGAGVGVLALGGETVGDGRDAWRIAIGLLLVVGNGVAGWILGTRPSG